MTRIISVHSFRGGTGKSTTAANLAITVAQRGYRVGLIDIDVQSPGLHLLFDLDEEQVSRTLNDYLWGHCPIEETVYKVSLKTGAGEVIVMGGGVYLVPASLKVHEIARIVREGYNVELLNEGFRQMTSRLNLDYLFIDTHPGLNEETLISLAISDALFIILRPDRRDYQGTAVVVEVARRLDVPRVQLIVNQVPTVFDLAEFKTRVEQIYDCPVAAVLPHSDQMMLMAGSGLFVLQYPDHPITTALRHVATRLAV